MMTDYTELLTQLRSFAESDRDDKCCACKYEEDYPPCVSCINRMVSDAADAIENLYSEYHGAGHWTFDDFDDDRFPYQCSNCHQWARMSYHYCPWCGADMRKETQNV